MTTIAPFARFIAAMTTLLDGAGAEADVLESASAELRQLIARDDWLPDTHAQADPVRYRQYLLYRDPAGRFSVVSFVWGPGQSTPIHDHGVWGLIGMLRGAEISETFAVGPDGAQKLGETRLQPGAIDAVSPRIGDIHRVRNAFDDRVSISVHVYGGDIGTMARHVYDADGAARPFVSGYADGPPLIV